MQQFTIEKTDGNKIACVKVVPDHPAGIVIGIHGFSSSKEASTYYTLLERLPSAGIGVICLDLPGHGTGESAKETLRISGALDSIGAVEEYALREYPGCEIFYFGSSFGAYLSGLYISARPHAGRKAFWRSAAVNMPSLFHKENPTEIEKKQLSDLDTKGYFDTSLDLNKSVRITRGMYDDLGENDLFEKFDAGRFGEHQILMVHGRNDEVISPKEAERFADRFQIPIIWFEGEGHSISKDSASVDRVMELAIKHFSSVRG